MEGHSLELTQNEDGWDVPKCECGAVGPPCPDKEIAAEFWAQHLLEEERTNGR